MQLQCYCCTWNDSNLSIDHEPIFSAPTLKFTYTYFCAVINYSTVAHYVDSLFIFAVTKRIKKHFETQLALLLHHETEKQCRAPIESGNWCFIVWVFLMQMHHCSIYFRVCFYYLSHDVHRVQCNQSLLFTYFWTTRHFQPFEYFIYCFIFEKSMESISFTWHLAVVPNRLNLTAFFFVHKSLF